MLKLSIKPLAVSTLFAMSLTSAATLAVAQENRGIVLQESAAEAPGYCHIKYMAITEESLRTGHLEFDRDNIIDRYGDCSFDPSGPEEVRKQLAGLNRSLYDDGSGTDGE
jgi:hypothetical protein